ncbi:hypothetical protein AMAG_00434 [Allomyces macrogynus ATCC 38327]|uniref:Uncharacterized protein n=1 Tax=Allomyces macrogynus (strain ATCC 38327) TaxID=578462 RepID=A0A0L0RWJ1_ALLM3|nr:hypothetical protein AMAG_00434 [Allomyces macrogynus ATCC 38327]|eukprot:KNE54460.1 hypothetical protein AMAG_00434 [Allomyces macrogynus ATCC 38327]
MLHSDRFRHHVGPGPPPSRDASTPPPPPRPRTRRFADYTRAEIRTQATRNAPPRDHTPAAAIAEEDAEAGSATAGRAYVPDLNPLHTDWFDAPPHLHPSEAAGAHATAPPGLSINDLMDEVEDKLRGTVLEPPQLKEPLKVDPALLVKDGDGRVHAVMGESINDLMDEASDKLRAGDAEMLQM